jgi:hypothetical protein
MRQTTLQLLNVTQPRYSELFHLDGQLEEIVQTESSEQVCIDAERLAITFHTESLPCAQSRPRHRRHAVSLELHMYLDTCPWLPPGSL